MISNKLYKISKLIIAGNVNQLSNIFQDKWMYENFKIDYSELNEKEIEDLKQYIKNRKEEVEKEALNLKISKNIKKDLQIWCVNNKKTMTEVIESSIKEYLNKNKF